jgi:putative ABC transport system substrate-binding protein
MSKLAFLTQRVDLNSPQTTSVRAAAEAAGIRLHISIFDVPTRETVFQEAIETAASNGASAILVADSAEATTNRGLIVRLIATIGMPAMYAITEFVDEGGLIAYSYDLVDLNKRVANDIDAILRGANPGDIPYYQATRFELSLNMKTANALGLTVPPALLAVADRVVE